MELPTATVANENVELNGEIAKIFTCPVCLHLFQTPKLLPNCGHSLCLGCVKKLLPDDGAENGPTKLTCPECRSENEIAKNDVEKLKTNFPAQRAVELLKVEENGPRFRVGDSCPHVDKFAKSSHRCPHCQADFCNVCLVSHLEKMKIETKWIASRFSTRLESVAGEFESNFDSLKSCIEAEVRTVQEQILSETDRLLLAVQTAARENCDRLLAEAQHLGELKLAKANQIVELTASARSRADSVKGCLQVLNEMSPVYSSSSEFAEIYLKVRDYDKELFTIGELEKTVRASQIVFNAVETNFIGLIPNVFEITLKLDEVPPLNVPSEELRLHQALRANNVEEVRNTFEALSPAVRSFLTEYGTVRTQLQLAAEVGAFDVVKFLIEEQHADVQSRTDETPFHLAVANGNLKVAEYLVGLSPCSVSALDKAKNSALHLAAKNGHLDMVNFLLNLKDIDVEKKDDSGQTALHLAAANGHLKIVESLVETAGGASLLVADKNGRLPIHIAAYCGHADVVKYLIGKKGDLMESQDSKNNTPIHLAAMKGNLGVIDMLLDVNPASVNANPCWTPLHAAAANDLIEAIRLLVKRGANISEPSNNFLGYSAMHWASFYGCTNAVKVLADLDPSLVNSKSKNTPCETPLQVAIKRKHFDVAKILATEYKAI